MPGDRRRFGAGETIAIREVLDGKVWTVRPVRVVDDREEGLVSYLAPGTVIDYPVGVEHGEVCFSMWRSGAWELEKKAFRPPGMLRIAQEGRPYEVFGFLAEGGGISSWYVNFQRPFERTATGYDTMDETLDLLVAADFSTWTRRDEDELELAVAMGVYRPTDVERITATCASVEDALRRGSVPWDTHWADWTPPPE